jgi:hypothetical protein
VRVGDEVVIGMCVLPGRHRSKVPDDLRCGRWTGAATLRMTASTGNESRGSRCGPGTLVPVASRRGEAPCVDRGHTRIVLKHPSSASAVSGPGAAALRPRRTVGQGGTTVKIPVDAAGTTRRSCWSVGVLTRSPGHHRDRCSARAACRLSGRRDRGARRGAEDQPASGRHPGARLRRGRGRVAECAPPQLTRSAYVSADVLRRR